MNGWGTKKHKQSLRQIVLASFTAALCVAFSVGAEAAASITVDSVAQRWPWNNKIDITYTVSGGQDVSLGVFARIVFTAHIGGTDYPIDGVHEVGANASDGQHTVTWTAPAGIRASGCTVTAQLLAADNPSGDDYMVVDLDTGVVSYEGLLATQAESNARYTNNVAYLTDKLVLRKIPAWGARTSLPNATALSALAGYPTGDDANYGASSTAALKNGSAFWQTTTDYYMGVFPVTQGQYVKLGLSNPSYNKSTDALGHSSTLLPVEKITWNGLRVSGTAPTSSVPAVATFTGTFLQRLNFRTGLLFDLPTELMWEIAARAGATTTYPWGDSYTGIEKYVSTKPTNKGSGSVRTLAVNALLPNAWGFYDMVGNVLEHCLDDASLANLSSAADPLRPAFADGESRIMRGGSNYNSSANATDAAKLRPSARSAVALTAAGTSAEGFRVAFIVP